MLNAGSEVTRWTSHGFRFRQERRDRKMPAADTCPLRTRPGAWHRDVASLATRLEMLDAYGWRQMSSTPLVAWSFALPSGNATRPSVTIGLFQWPPPALSVVTSFPLAGW